MDGLNNPAYIGAARRSLPQTAEALDKAIIANEELAAHYAESNHPNASDLHIFHTMRAENCLMKIDEVSFKESF